MRYRISKSKGVITITPDPNGNPYVEPMSEKQKQYLLSLGCYPEELDGLSMSEAREAIKKVLAAKKTVLASTPTSVSDWLKSKLSDGPKLAKVLIEDGAAVGYTYEQLRYASQKLGVTTKKLGLKAGFQWSIAQTAIDYDDDDEGSPF